MQAKLNQLTERFGESVAINPELFTMTNESVIARKETGRKSNLFSKKISLINQLLFII